MLWATIGRVPGLFLYCYIGTLGQLAVRIMRGRSYPRMFEYWTWGGAFITTVLLLMVLGRVAYRVIQTSPTGPSGAGSSDALQRQMLSR